MSSKKRKGSRKHTKPSFKEFYSVEDVVGYGDKARQSAWRLVEKITYELASELPARQAPQFQDHLIEALRELNGAIFSEVNSRPRENPAFQEALTNSWLRFTDGRAVHLELGTWSAWPDDAVERRIAEDRIGDFIRLDFSADYPIDVVASATSLPFADETVDRISSNSLFEHVAYPHQILRECFRVLRRGGMFITKVPFHFVYHSCPGDYLRYTHEFFDAVCNDIGFTDVITDSTMTSGLYFTIHQLAKAAIVSPYHPYARAARKAHLTVLELLAALHGLDDAFYGEGRSFWHTTQVVATKPGIYFSREEKFDRTRPFSERFLPHLICPATGLPLMEDHGELVSLDGSHRYAVKNGVPSLVVMHGFASGFSQRPSSREQLRRFREASEGGDGERRVAQAAPPDTATIREPEVDDAEKQRILSRYFSAEQIATHLTFNENDVVTAGYRFRFEGDDMRLIAVPAGVHFPARVRDQPSRLVWEAVAKLKASVFRSRDETITLARTGGLYDEDYFTRRGGGSPYTGYPMQEDGSSGTEHAKTLAQELIDVFGPSRILDVGCATGILVKELQERGADAWGIDFSEWAVKHAICQNIIRANARQLAMFADGTFDVVISQDFFEHVAVEHVEAVLAELCRVTRPGGWGLHFIPFYAEFAEPIAIDAHLCSANKAWWDSVLAAAGGHEVEIDAPAENQWDYSDGILSRYYWLRAV